MWGLRKCSLPNSGQEHETETESKGMTNQKSYKHIIILCHNKQITRSYFKIKSIVKGIATVALCTV